MAKHLSKEVLGSQYKVLSDLYTELDQTYLQMVDLPTRIFNSLELLANEIEDYLEEIEEQI